jgi:hypothetical protein
LGAVVGAGLAQGFFSAPADWIRGTTPTVTRQLNAIADGASMEMGGQLFGAAFRSLKTSAVAAPVAQGEVRALLKGHGAGAAATETSNVVRVAG